MKFKAAGIFEPETIVDVAQRLTAVLQDAGVVRVENVSVYLTIVDKSGARRSLQLGEDVVDTFALDCADLACPAPAARLKVGRTAAGPARRSVPTSRRRS